MKVKDKEHDRLRTKNFKRVTSDAVVSIDYDEKLKILEIEYKTGKVYHYIEINKKTWKKFLALAGKGEGLGVYINQVFKDIIEKNDNDYYEVISNDDKDIDKQYSLH